MKLIPVILSGGAGSRLWPLSRENYPKPFIRMQDQQSLLQKAILRALALDNLAEIFIVSNIELFDITENEYKEINTNNTKCSYILEPVGKNTAPAITSAVITIAQTISKQSIILVLPADHLITKVEAFKNAVGEAGKFAEQDQIVTFGILPTSAETGYGYLEVDGNKVNRFIEKPNQQTANDFFTNGNYYWNSGMFCFKSSAIISQIQKHCPQIYSQVNKSIELAKITKLDRECKKIELDTQTYGQIREDSIDYAIMEKVDNLVAIKSDLGWSDLGSWNALSQFIEPDQHNNRILGKTQINQSHDCTIYGGDRIIGLVGVKNMVVVDTPDALLIADKNKTQDVNQIYKNLKAKGDKTYQQHQIVNRPWGSFTVLDQGIGFKIKRIEVKPGETLSLQMHHHRSEHWIVVAGSAKIINQDQELILNTDQSTYIPIGGKHRLENPGKTQLIIIEVQIGSYLEEDDIVRFQDQYRRI